MIVILGALETEIAEFLEVLQPIRTVHWQGFIFHHGLLDGREVLVGRCGVGKVMSALVAQHLIEHYEPAFLVLTGIAGSLRPHIGLGDTLVANDLVQHDLESAGFRFPRGQVPFSDYRFLSSAPDLLEAASDFRPEAGRLHLGRICTGDQFIATRGSARHSYLTEELEGDAVEMEGASVALVCTVNQLPFLVVRSISDQADGQTTREEFEAFLPEASRNSVAFVRHLLARIAIGSLAVAA